MKRNKISTIFLVTILAMAGIGISYAGFTDQITVTGVVTTGCIEFQILEYSGTWVWKEISTHKRYIHQGEPIEHHGDGVVDDDPTAAAAGWYEDTDHILIAYSYAHNDIPSTQVGFEFVNLYPCIEFHADFKFKIGSIPVILQTAVLSWTNEKINDIPTLWINGLGGGIPDPTVVVEIYYYDESSNKIVVQPEDQLHPCVTYIWDLKIHIPQHNAYMNAYAEGSGTLEIIQLEDDCDDTTTDDKTITIPTDPEYLTMTLYNDYPAGFGFFKTVLTNVPAGTWSPPIAEGAECIGWCVDNTPPGSSIGLGVGYKTYLYNSYDLPTSLPGGWPNLPWMTDTDWPYVNWIINNKGSATQEQIQEAIWHFVNGGYAPYPGGDPVIVGLIDGALGNPEGDSYKPPADQIPPSVIAVICWVDASVHGQKQLTIIEVDP